MFCMQGLTQVTILKEQNIIILMKMIIYGMKGITGGFSSIKLSFCGNN